MENNKKLYSQKTIAIATFVGGPLAAAIVIRRNYLNLNQEEKALKTILIGIVGTAILFYLLYIMPDGISDKIAQFVLPFIYTSATYYIVEKIQGEDLKNHSEEGGEFYSKWRATGIGLLITALIFVSIFGFIYTSKPDFINPIYDKEVSTFSSNEKRALNVFNVIETADNQYLIKEFSKGLVIWKENKEIIERMMLIENLPIEIVAQNDKLKTYCVLRIKHYELFIKALTEESDKYANEIDVIGIQINEILKELN